MSSVSMSDVLSSGRFSLSNVDFAVITWNLNGATPGKLAVELKPVLIEQLFPAKTPAFIVFGFQEFDSRPSAFYTKDVKRIEEWKILLQKTLSQIYPKDNFSLFFEICEAGFSILVFQCIDYIGINLKLESSCFVGTGPLWLANKGALSCSISLEVVDKDSHSLLDFDDDLNRPRRKTICLVNSHLAPHAKGLKRRRREFLAISRRTIFSAVGCQRIWDHDLILWFGDLNYRVDESIIKRESIFKILVDNPRERQYAQIQKVDQLYTEMKNEFAFPAFHEGDVRFEPTFKYDIGTRNSFDSSKKARAPAWCDRILWTFGSVFTQPQKQPGHDDLIRVPDLSLIKYISCMDLTISDHKPVAAFFTLNPMKEKDDYIRKGRKLTDKPFPNLLQIDPYYSWKCSIGKVVGMILGFGFAEPRIFIFTFFLISSLIFFSPSSSKV